MLSRREGGCQRLGAGSEGSANGGLRMRGRASGLFWAGRISAQRSACDPAACDGTEQNPVMLLGGGQASLDLGACRRVILEADYWQIHGLT